MPLPPPVILPLPQGHKDLAVALSPAGDRLAVGLGRDLQIYEVSGAAPRLCYSGQAGEDSYGRPRFAPDGALWAGLDRLDPATGAWAQALHLPAEHHGVGDLAFLPDGRVAKQALIPGGHAVALFAPGKTGYELQLLTEPKPLPYDAVLAAAPDGETVALSRDHVHVFDTRKGKAWKRLPKEKVHHGAFACFCEQGLLFTRDPPGSSYFDHRYHVQLMVPAGKRAFEEGRTFELAGADVPLGLGSAGGRVLGLWKPLGTLKRTMVRVWDLATGAALVEEEVEGGLRSLALSADGAVWAAADWSNVYLFRA